MNTTTLEQDACELLDADHIAVKHLFVLYARLATAQPTESASDRRTLAARICAELTAHAQVEEEIFYPALRSAVPDSAAQLDEAEAEHQQAKDLIARIEAGLADDAGRDALVAELAAAIDHHVKEERDELFPKARSGGLDLAELASRLEARRGELQQKK